MRKLFAILNEPTSLAVSTFLYFVRMFCVMTDWNFKGKYLPKFHKIREKLQTNTSSDCRSKARRWLTKETAGGPVLAPTSFNMESGTWNRPVWLAEQARGRQECRGRAAALLGKKQIGGSRGSKHRQLQAANMVHDQEMLMKAEMRD